jgi:hypothetical protein
MRGLASGFAVDGRGVAHAAWGVTCRALGGLALCAVPALSVLGCTSNSPAPGDATQVTRGAAEHGGTPGNAGGVPVPAWDWVGVVGSGQSLSVGAQASDVATTTQPYGNLKLALGGAVVPPFDAENAALSLVPLVEPIRPFGTAYPSAYPANIYGETPHSAMANQITALARGAGAPDYVGVHTVVGENGQGMAQLRKGAAEVVVGATSKGRAFAATLFEARAIRRLAAARGKTYGIGAIILTHGETDSGNANYEAELVQLWTDYNTDLAAITGQTQSIPMLVTQHHAFGFTAGQRSGPAASTLAQWRVGVNHPRDIICSGPKYQYPYAADNLHLVTRGYQLLGEKYGEVYYERVVLGRDWQPLQPLRVERAGRVVTVHFHVPVPPLAWDDVLPAPHQSALTEWAAARGFELSLAGTPLAIESVAIASDSIQIVAAADVPAGALLGYAATSDGTVPPNMSRRWGLLRDSDALVGAVTGQAQPNYAVAFELPVP